MKIDLSRFRASFFEEAAEHLASLESGLLRLEAAPQDLDLLNGIFRSAHSIKGSSGMFGLTEVTRFTHALESVLDRLRQGTLSVTPARADLLIRATDTLRVLLASARDNEGPPADLDAIIAELSVQLAPVTASAAPATVSPTPTSACWAIEFAPAADVFKLGMDPMLVLRDLAGLGEVLEVTVDLTALPSLNTLDPELCYLAWRLRLRTSAYEIELRDLFAFVEDGARLVIARETAAPPPARDSAQAIAAPLERRQRVDRRAPVIESGSIRVSTEKVDELINLVGELVISQSMVSQIVASVPTGRQEELEGAVAAMERNLRELQERVMAVRMMPIGHVFSRFPRLVRDLASTFGKNVVLEVSGEETELDKGVIEQVADPLTHLIRNAVDHGMDSAAERLAAGKPEQGTVRLSAAHRGGSVMIEVSEDGRGLDTDRIRRKAITAGLISADDKMTDDQIHALIFQAGFSTAEVVSDVSGRGVGMDVVRRNVEALNGSIAIETAKGRGTTIRIKLPLTLAILDGMSLGVGGQTYILPLLSIIESLRPPAASLKTILGKGEVVVVRGEALPLVRLHRMLAVEGAVTDPTRALVVVVDHEGRHLAVMVDELLGQSQVVIKNLEANYRRVDGIMGATITGEGRVALILDVQGLARLAEHGGNGAAWRAGEDDPDGRWTGRALPSDQDAQLVGP